ncbi:MAG: hypothetical protein OXQ29_01220 [Rhodospirillaceae bacterium]|nr:hypothetical protein [Rhodospirillaceae bacterium]
MSNTIAVQDWLRVIDDEYLSTFVRDGGASVKFAVTSDESKTELYSKMGARCRALGYLCIELDACTTRAHMPQDLFFGFAAQVDWRLLARRVILTLAEERGYQVAGISPDATSNVYDAIAGANGLESRFVLGEIRPKIQAHVFRNPRMAKDFRVCMSQLCLCEDVRGEYAGQPLLDWLTGTNTRLSNVRDFSIHTGINRTTARYFIESALYWIHYARDAGTVILFDNARVTVARNPRDGIRYYTRPMAMEHYELLREFIDGVDRLAGTLLVVVANPDFLDEGSDRRSRGYGIYQALRTRVMDDVRDRHLVNPVASLVRLSSTETAPRPLTGQGAWEAPSGLPSIEVPA